MSTPHKGDLQEMKSLSKPPQDVVYIMSAILCLLGYPKGQADDWKYAKKVLGDFSLLKKMNDFQPKAISSKKADYVKGKLDGLDESVIRKKCAAATSFYKWAKVTLDSIPVSDSEEKKN